MKAKLTIEKITAAAKVLKCVAHPQRLRLVECLEGRELSVGDLVGKLGLGQAVVSKHLSVLRRSGIVRSKIQKNYRYYSIAYPNVVQVLDCMRRHGG